MDIAPSESKKQDWTSAKEFVKQYGSAAFCVLIIANTAPNKIEKLKIPENIVFEVLGTFYYQKPLHEIFALEQWQALRATNTLQCIEKHRLDSLCTWQEISEDDYNRLQNNKIPKIVDQTQKYAPQYRSKKCSRYIPTDLFSSSMTCYIFQNLPSYEAPDKIEPSAPHQASRSGLAQALSFKQDDIYENSLSIIPGALHKNIEIIYLSKKSDDSAELCKIYLRGALNAKTYNLKEFWLKEIIYRTEIANGSMLQDLFRVKFGDKSPEAKKQFLDLVTQKSHNELKTIDINAYPLLIPKTHSDYFNT
jgi:hypothetical protein